MSATKGFNTQPPEGGWNTRGSGSYRSTCFNTQPPEGGWINKVKVNLRLRRFNTQPPEGGWYRENSGNIHTSVSTHSRPKAAGFGAFWVQNHQAVSTHSRPKAAGRTTMGGIYCPFSFNTQPPEGGWQWVSQADQFDSMFQHTAARRRLANIMASSA